MNLYAPLFDYNSIVVFKMSQQSEDKKVLDLRNLLAKAKKKIEELQSKVGEKENQNISLRNSYEQKIKLLEKQSAQIMKQYEQRLLRYQKSLKESENLVSKYQAQALSNSKSNQQNNNSFHKIGNILMRIFTLAKVKDNVEAVQQLCTINKCKQFAEEISKIQCTQEMQPVIKCILKLNDLQAEALTKKRQARLSYIKRESLLKNQLQEVHKESSNKQSKIIQQQRLIKKQEMQWQAKIAEISKNKLKTSQDKINHEYLKSMLLKIFIGPKQSAQMALEVICKMLKMSADEVKIIQKYIK